MIDLEHFKKLYIRAACGSSTWMLDLVGYTPGVIDELESLRSQLAAANEAKAKAERERDKLIRWVVEWGWSLVEVEMEYGIVFRAFGDGIPTVEALAPEAAIRKAAGLEPQS